MTCAQYGFFFFFHNFSQSFPNFFLLSLPIFAYFVFLIFSCYILLFLNFSYFSFSCFLSFFLFFFVYFPSYFFILSRFVSFFFNFFLLSCIFSCFFFSFFKNNISSRFFPLFSYLFRFFPILSYFDFSLFFLFYPLSIILNRKRHCTALLEFLSDLFEGMGLKRPLTLTNKRSTVLFKLGGGQF